MDFIDIIFYIVLAVIGIFSTFIQKKAEKKAKEIEKQQRPNSDAGDANAPAPFDIWGDDDEVGRESEMEKAEGEERELSLDDIFEMLRKGTPSEPEQKPVPPQRVPEPQPAPRVIEQPRARMVPVTPAAPISKVSALAQSEISDIGVYDENEAVAFDIDNVDWRQAIITNEILNRKY